MNLLHINGQPLWFDIAVVSICLVLVIAIIWLVISIRRVERDLPIIEIDELQRLIDQGNKHCRVKADYDCHG